MESIEARIQAKGLTAPRVKPEDLDAEIVGTHYFTAAEAVRILPPESSLHRMTFCVLELRNGMTVTGESACVSAANFNAEFGRDIALANAKNKLWPLLGFRLADKLAGAA